MISVHMRLILQSGALLLIFAAELNGQSFCLITTPDWNCSTEFTPKTPLYCSSAGQFCENNACPGEPWQVENASDWSINRTKADLAKYGETGTTGTQKDFMCSWKQECICRYDPADPPGWKRCAKNRRINLCLSFCKT